MGRHVSVLVSTSFLALVHSTAAAVPSATDSATSGKSPSPSSSSFPGSGLKLLCGSRLHAHSVSPQLQSCWGLGHFLGHLQPESEVPSVLASAPDK